MPDVDDELRAFRQNLEDYAEILNAVWQRAPGHGWFGGATPQERQRIDRLRDSLAEQYGGLHDAIAEAHGSEPIIEAAGIVGGDAFQLAVADPADNPWLSAALDLGPPLVAQAIGYHRMRRRGRARRFVAAAYREVKDWARIVVDPIAKILRP